MGARPFGKGALPKVSLWTLTYWFSIQYPDGPHLVGGLVISSFFSLQLRVDDCKIRSRWYTYNSNSHVCGLHCLTFVCENKAGKSMQWGESSFRKCIKKSSALSHIKYGEVSLQIEFATLPPKNHNLLVKEEWKGNWKNKENAATGW